MQPDIYVGTLRLSEPVIALTGLFIAFTCAYAWFRLHNRPVLTPAQHWMKHFFLLMAISALFGPFFGHLFYYWAGFPGKYASWVFSIFSMAALAQGAIEHARDYHLKPTTARWLTGLNIGAMLVAAIVSAVQQSFMWVEVHSALTLLGFLGTLEGSLYLKHRASGSRLLLWSLPVAMLAVIPHVIKWSPSVWFTYFDVGHVIVCFSLWLILRGTEAISPRQTA